MSVVYRLDSSAAGAVVSMLPLYIYNQVAYRVFPFFFFFFSGGNALLCAAWDCTKSGKVSIGTLTQTCTASLAFQWGQGRCTECRWHVCANKKGRKIREELKMPGGTRVQAENLRWEGRRWMMSVLLQDWAGGPRMAYGSGQHCSSRFFFPFFCCKWRVFSFLLLFRKLLNQGSIFQVKNIQFSIKCGRADFSKRNNLLLLLAHTCTNVFKILFFCCFKVEKGILIFSKYYA